MRRKTLEGLQCPIARSLDRVGEWWSLLIIRDALSGVTRFDDFQTGLDIAPNMLTRRLTTLVEAGFMTRRQYSDRPPRFEYILTERGLDFRPVMQALMAFGNRQFAPEGRSVIIENTETGMEAEPILVDKISGRELNDPAFQTKAGPVANDFTRSRIRFERS